MNKQKIIDYYFYKHYFAWIFLIYLTVAFYGWFVFLGDEKDFNKKLSYFILFTILNSAITYCFSLIVLKTLITNKKYIQFLTKTIKEEYSFDLKEMFEKVFNQNQEIYDYFKEISFLQMKITWNKEFNTFMKKEFYYQNIKKS